MRGAEATRRDEGTPSKNLAVGYEDVSVQGCGLVRTERRDAAHTRLEMSPLCIFLPLKTRHPTAAATEEAKRQRHVRDGIHIPYVHVKEGGTCTNSRQEAFLVLRALLHDIAEPPSRRLPARLWQIATTNTSSAIAKSARERLGEIG